MKTIMFSPQSDENAVKTAAGLILQGEVVGIPTETVYGLAANALNGEAVAKIFRAKGRPQANQRPWENGKSKRAEQQGALPYGSAP